MREEQSLSATRRTPWKRTLLVLCVLVIAIAGAIASWKTLERSKIKQTVTNVATLGRMCLAERPETVDRESLRKLAERLGASDESLFVDAWGNEIKVIRTSDDSGIHYIVFSIGPSAVSMETPSSLTTLPSGVEGASFIWRDGTWVREYDPRRGGIVERR